MEDEETRNETLTPPTVLFSSSATGDLSAISTVGADDAAPRRESRRSENFGCIFNFFYSEAFGPSSVRKT